MTKKKKKKHLYKLVSTWTKSWPIIFSRRAFIKLSIWITLRLQSSLLLLQTPQTSRLPARDRERAHNACLKTKRKGDKATFPLTKQKKYWATGREILLYQLITSDVIARMRFQPVSLHFSVFVWLHWYFKALFFGGGNFPQVTSLPPHFFLWLKMEPNKQKKKNNAVNVCHPQK